MSTKRILTATLAAFSLIVGASLIEAQMQGPPGQSPVITFVSPVGGQAGDSFELRVAGVGLDSAEDLHFNFPGVKVELIGATTEKGGVDKKGKGLPAVQGQKFKVTLPANAPVGIQDVRVVTKKGISNPRAFVISKHKEFVEVDPNDDVPKAQKIELNSAVSGVISTPTDVDYYQFTGKKGERVVISCMAPTIDSRLVAELKLYGQVNNEGSSSELGSVRASSNGEAMLDAVLPADGDYYVRICQFTYTLGGPDYFYRLSISTAPWIDAVYPPVVEPGKATQVTVYGRNLPGGKADPEATLNNRPLEKATVTITPPSDAKATQRLHFGGTMSPPGSMIDGFDYRLESPAGTSNPYLVTYASAPVVLDNGDNDSKDKPQQIKLPCVIAGKIEKRGDRDWYAFTAKKGEVYHFEAFAERLGAPIDLYFQIRDERNNLVTEQQDNTEILSTQFYTGTADPGKYRFVAPADGTYFLLVTALDAFTQYGPRSIYTVHITSEQPDFRLIAMPASLTTPEATVLNQGGGAAFNVYVWRSGGFNGDIHLSGENLPPGVEIPPQFITGSQKVANLVVQARGDAKLWAGGINVVGTATVNGKKLVREVRGASITWPVPAPNVPTISRLDRELVVAVREKAPYTLALNTQKIQVNLGEKIAIPVKVVPDAGFKTAVQVIAIGGPTGFTSTPVTITPGQGGTASLDLGKGAANAQPGNYTIFLRGATQPINPKQPPPKGAPANIGQISAPIQLTIVPKQLGKVTVTPANAKLAPGKEIELIARVARQYDLPASFKVEAVLPPNVKGLSAKAVTINADQDEAKLILSAEPGAVIAPNTSVTVRFTSMFNETIPIVHEAKLTVSLAK